MSAKTPICHVVAGPNGSGKSTFALRHLPEYAGTIEFVNPDLMAKGLSPTNIALSAIEAGRMTLARIERLIAAKATFGFETTLSGRGYLGLLTAAHERGYDVRLYYLWIPAASLLPPRIRHRVLSGGHDVPTDDVLRRYSRSRANFRAYARLANEVSVFDATTLDFELLIRRDGWFEHADAVRVSQARKDLSL